MKHARLFASVPLVLLLGCASAAQREESPHSDKSAQAGADEKKDEKKAREIRGLRRKLEVARARIEVARMEAEAFERAHEVRRKHSAAEVELAEAALLRFQEAQAPNRLASERLDLRTARDRAQEAAEELEQIEIMYAEQDLDDLTAEFVVSRGRRNAERAAARIEIQEGELRALEERELPQERRRLELDLDRKRAELAALERDGEIERRKKAVSVSEAENQVAGLEDELKAALEEEEA